MNKYILHVDSMFSAFSVVEAGKKFDFDYSAHTESKGVFSALDKGDLVYVFLDDPDGKINILLSVISNDSRIVSFKKKLESDESFTKLQPGLISQLELKTLVEIDDALYNEIYKTLANHSTESEKMTLDEVSEVIEANEFEDYTSKQNFFDENYSIDILKALNDKELTERLFASKDFAKANNLPRGYVIWAEHGGENDKRNTIPFGMTKGHNGGQTGVLLKPDGTYHVYNYSYQTNPSTGKTEKKCDESVIDFTSAADLAHVLLNCFSKVTDYISKNNFVTQKDYDNLLSFVKSELSAVHESRLYWNADGEPDGIFIKYLCCSFPQIFSCWYSKDRLKKLLLPIFEASQLADNALVLNGQLSILANSLRVEVDNANFGAIWGRYIFNLPEETDDEMEEDIGEFINTNKIIERKPRTNPINSLNLIIYGAPGTGKTYSTAEYAVAIIENRNVRKKITEKEREQVMSDYRNLSAKGQIVFTTFHQNYSYEDFIQGLRPTSTNGVLDFIPSDGVFKKISERAMKDLNNNYVIIIDEINRGNISKIFGELITLIEDDKRWGEANQLSVSLPSGEEFAVPNNLYIVGTMNSADKSIALIDTALRRRFEFEEVSPDPSLVTDPVLNKVFTELNNQLRKQLESSDLLIGHAYFIGKNANDLARIMNRNIIPLLYEYFFDQEKKVKDVLVKVLNGTSVSIVENSLGRIKVQ